jgi:hypothetical protein
MKWLYGGVVAVCVVLAGCGDSSVPGDPTGEDVPTSEAPEAPATTNGPRPKPDDSPPDNGSPGVPGSPIDYDSTVRGDGPENAKALIESELATKCKNKSRCGIKVVIKGRGKCIPSVSPDPVRPGQTITIVAEPCPTTEENPPTSDKPTTPSSR